MVQEKTLDAATYAKLDAYIDALPSKKGALISVLHKAQELFGYLPTELQNHVAHKLDIPSAKVYGVVTFYSFFTMVKKGQYRVNICMGTACFVVGAQDVLNKFKDELGINSGETTEDELFSLDALRCVGACGLAPVVSVGSKVFARVSVDDVKGIVDEFRVKGAEANV